MDFRGRISLRHLRHRWRLVTSSRREGIHVRMKAIFEGMRRIQTTVAKTWRMVHVSSVTRETAEPAFMMTEGILVLSPIRGLTSFSRMLIVWSAISTRSNVVENVDELRWMNNDPCVAAGELQKAPPSVSGRISSTSRKYLEAAIRPILVRPASIIAEQNGIFAMCSVLIEEGMDEDPDEKSDDSPPFISSDLSSVVPDIKRTILSRQMHRLYFPLQLSTRTEAFRSRLHSPLHDQYIEVERPFVRSQNSPGDSCLKCAMLILVILPP
jgi:hypothetical protein